MRFDMRRAATGLATLGVLAIVASLSGTPSRAQESGQETGQEGGSAEQRAVAPPPLVKLETLASASELTTRRFFGRIAARRTVDVAFQVGGQITLFDAIEGTRLGEGDVVAQLDLEPFEIARDRARVQREDAEADFERQRRLGRNTVAQVQIDDAETAMEIARLAEREAERNLTLATLRAPFDALIASRYVETFTTIQGGVRVVRLHDMSELRIEFGVPEFFGRDARDPSRFNIYAIIPEDETRYPLELREFNAETSEVGQTYSVTMAFIGDLNERILPGVSATVVVEPLTTPQVVVAPPGSVILSADRSAYVMVFEPDEASGAVGEDGLANAGVVRRTPVELGATFDGRVAIVSGVEAGVEIVAIGAARLQDGQRVRRFRGFDG